MKQDPHEFTLEDILNATGSHKTVKPVENTSQGEVLTKAEREFETTRILAIQDELFGDGPEVPVTEHRERVTVEPIREETPAVPEENTSPIEYTQESIYTEPTLPQPTEELRIEDTQSSLPEIESTQAIQVQDEVEEPVPPAPKRTKQPTKKKKRRLSKLGMLLMRLLLIGSIALAAFSGWKIYSGLKAYREGNRTYEDLVEYTQAGDRNGQAADEGIDFNALKEINPDFVGWLSLEGTVINYPVVQGQDNAYYLEHLFNGDVNHMGCIFLHYGNNPNMTDKNTWMFAHHTNNGSMFYTLESYKSQSFYDEHPEFLYQTPNGNYLIEPVAGMVVSGDEFSIETFMPTEEYVYSSDDFMEWVNFFVSNSTFRSRTSITDKDQIVTMVTCTDDYHNARYALISKLTKLD